MLKYQKNWKPSQKGETLQGYIRLNGKHNCPYSDKRGRIFEHRYVWWEKYGDKDIILKDENLHHKNGNKKDNRIENLEKVKIKGQNNHNHIHFFKNITKEEKKEYQKKWRKENKDHFNKCKRNWRRKNIEKIRKVETNYRLKNKDKIDLWNKRYREKHKEILRKKSNEWYHKNKKRTKNKKSNEK